MIARLSQEKPIRKAVIPKGVLFVANKGFVVGVKGMIKDLLDGLDYGLERLNPNI